MLIGGDSHQIDGTERRALSFFYASGLDTLHLDSKPTHFILDELSSLETQRLPLERAMRVESVL